ncbi:FtsK/SpoIIIE domain-containing protein [Agromyces sp. G08B096]|uniref:FtsK/SpoIIIE domain-containing protein n=1 Tax=Agromyces sp. G08B096 TaxID=3156399 RepID=A0AAU7W433_9MICO
MPLSPTESAAEAVGAVDPVDELAPEPLTLPPTPQPEPVPGFPVLASTAPMAGALALWAITGSALSLVFAAFGPIVAIASMLDARRQQRRRHRRALAERRAALDALEAELARRHAAELGRARATAPAARELAAGAPGAVWRAEPPSSLVVGAGAVPSAVRVSGAPGDDADRELLRRAARLEQAPIVVDPAGGIGLCGPGVLVRAAARSMLLQAAERAAPGAISFDVPATPEWSWAAVLPHHGRAAGLQVTDAGATAARAGDPSSAAWRLAIAPTEAELPPGLRTVLRLEGPQRAVLIRRAGLPAAAVVEPELLSVEEARDAAARLAEAARRAGLDRSAASLPRLVPFESLPQPVRRPADRTSLSVVVGATADGAVEIDLVGEGPHALVAGTSGSGKSEFLLAWLAALAMVHPPELVAFLLVDFKGGAAFEPLRGLPHVTGIVTDLDETEAQRAVESLRAELRHREHVLKAAGARDIARLGEGTVLPRLVIVVDEFQAMVERFPDLAPVIGDIAARGRSLGVHLVLASQRPNGVVREQVTANCGLRISLRVLERGDSIAVVGAEDAALLDAEVPGRAVLARPDRRPVELQSAFCSLEVLERIRDGATGAPARRPWLDPLPARIDPTELARLTGSGAVDGKSSGGAAPPEPGLVFGLVDEPDLQRWGLACWRPGPDGHLLVLGAPGSGRTGALNAVAGSFADRYGAEAVMVAGGPRSAEWDLLDAELRRLRAGMTVEARLLVIDDLDARYRAWPEDHRFSVVGTIEALVREGRAGGLRVSAAAVGAQGLPAGIREGFTTSLHLRHATRGDLVAAGGIGALWRAEEPQGAGQWRGRRIQIVDAPAPPARPAPAIEAWQPLPGAAVVSDSVATDVAALRRTTTLEILPLSASTDAAHRAASRVGGADAPIVVGDAEAWAANWMLLASMRDHGTLVVHGGTGEYRTVVRDRRPPPLLDPGRGQCWVLLPGAEPARRLWPGTA